MKSKISFFIVFLAALIGLGSVSDRLKVSLFSFTSQGFNPLQETLWASRKMRKDPELALPRGDSFSSSEDARHAEDAEIQRNENTEIQRNDRHRLYPLGFTSFQIHPSPLGEERLASSHDRLGVRQEMLELLDQLVRSEWEYHQTTGRFTNLISELPHFFFSAVDSGFELSVLHAQSDHFLAGVFSWENHQRSEQALVNEKYEIHAHFTIPEPSFDHLRSVALQHLKSLWNSSTHPPDDEPTLFKHYFKYQDTLDSQGQRVVTAWGLKGAVAGLILEWRGESSLSGKDGTMWISAPIQSDLRIERTQEKIQPAGKKVQRLQTFDALKMRTQAPSQQQSQWSKRSISSIHHSHHLSRGRLSTPSIHFQTLQSPLVIEPLEPPLRLKR